MHTWYRAACDEHQEMVDIFVNNPSTTQHLLSDKDELIGTFLSAHFPCKLRLVNEWELDDMWNDFDEWIDIKESDIPRKRELTLRGFNPRHEFKRII